MSINTDFQAEITRIFNKKSVSEISVDELNDLSARVFAETLGELDRLGGEIDKVLNASGSTNSNSEGDEVIRAKQLEDLSEKIDELREKYNVCSKFMSEKIVKSSIDKKSIKHWVEIAKFCDQNGNDFLGYTIRNAMVHPSLEQQAKLNNIAELNQELQKKYFESFQDKNTYINRLKNLTDNAISPLLLCYFNTMNIESVKKSEDESFKILKESLIGRDLKSTTSLTEQKNGFEKKSLSTSNESISKSKKAESDNYLKLKASLKNAKAYYRKREKEIKNLFESKLNVIRDKKRMITGRMSNAKNADDNNQKEFAKSDRKEYLARVSARLFKKKQEPDSSKRPIDTDNKLNNNKKIR